MGATAWEELPMQTPLQGLALVAHDGKLYRVGGMNARNATTDDEEDLHSTDEFAQYDPATKKWTALAPLPAPRSSLNAVVIGERIYVTGGWTLNGSRKGEWLDDSLVYDFADPSCRLANVCRSKRSSAALWPPSQWHGKLARGLGGMNEKGKVSRRVDFFDPATGQWTAGPKLPGSGMSRLRRLGVESRRRSLCLRLQRPRVSAGRRRARNGNKWPARPATILPSAGSRNDERRPAGRRRRFARWPPGRRGVG